MKVKSLPHLSHFQSEESGIKRVVEAYFKHLPDFGIELVSPDSGDYDLLVAHAGMGDGTADVAMLHGLYWTGDFDNPPMWEMDSNRRIVNDIRQAKQVTVPSKWVAETFQRDLRYTPQVCGHGIEWQDWQHNHSNEGYVLWNKNRIGDVCDPAPLNRLSKQFPQTHFVSTFGNKRQNVYVINGIIKHEQMKQLIQQAAIYLSTTKETFGIGVLEAMASGIPVLGWAFGGNLDLIEHGINGYLAKPNDFEDLYEGLNYCLQNRDVLGANGREMAKEWTWEKAVEKVAGVYRLALEVEKPTVSIVIPVFNKTVEEVERAIESVINQTYKPDAIIVIDDGSENGDGISRTCEKLRDRTSISIRLIRQSNSGVAIARNRGISETNGKYVTCLDADDWLESTFLETCVQALESDRSLGIAYTYLKWHRTDGATGLGGFSEDGKGSPWPHECEPDKQLRPRNKGNNKGLNQVPTCCVFKREMWERLGGYRQRYAPEGAGEEDAEFWTRAFAYGYKAEMVTNEPLFNYSIGSGQVSGNIQHYETDWLTWHPWARDNQHPFASYATPKRLSHPVRQYDEPLVSVIIPVGPGHEKEVINALDSIEAQTFRKWEVIVVWDYDTSYQPTSDDPSDDPPIEIYTPEIERLKSAYPYAKMVFSGSMWGGNKGAGFARNCGVRFVRAPFILFLDADDTLYPDCLQEMLQAWQYHQKIIYSNFVGQAFIKPELAKKYQDEERLRSYNPKTYEAIIGDSLPDFDCAKAMQQPQDKPYLWCNITTLVPKAWHQEIGGFDESMETWEDVDYWWRMARAGKCFHKIKKELMRYRYYTGNRRHIASTDSESGRQIAKSMLEYLREKYKGIEAVPCGCKDKKKQVVTATKSTNISDSEFTRARYLGKHGNHEIVGGAIFDYDVLPGSTVRTGNRFKIKYADHKSRGFITLVHNEDIRLMVNMWEVVPEVNIPAPVEPELPPPVPLRDIEIIDEIVHKPDFALDNIPGVTPKIAKEFLRLGLDTKEKILEADLVQVKGIAEKRAKIIKGALEK